MNGESCKDCKRQFTKNASVLINFCCNCKRGGGDRSAIDYYEKKYGCMESIIYELCPNCGNQAFSEGVDVGVGYVYPPIHCNCGWSEQCYLKDTEKCDKKCTEYENCYSDNR